MRLINFLRRILTTILLSFISIFITYSSSCLPGWKYQMELNITSSSALSNFQVMLEFNTATYVSSGKMNISGSDIRFMDDNNNLLSHWIVPGTFNTSNTQIWINVSDIAVGDSEIYMYFGNNEAYNTSSGEETFMFFDDFERGTDDWVSCGGGHYLDNGSIVLYSTEDNNNQALMKTNQAFTAPFISEMKVKNVTGDNLRQFSLLQTNADDEGFGLTSIESNVIDSMEITRFSSGTNCFIEEKAYGNAKLTSGTSGIWQFIWSSPNSQNGVKGESDVNLQATDNAYSSPVSLNSGLAVFGSIASVTVDWYRIRKYASTEPTIVINAPTEIELPDAGNINIGSNAPLCEGESLYLNAEAIANADYTWFNPIGTEISNIVIPEEIPNPSAGNYQLIVVPTLGACTSITLEVEVDIYPTANAETIEGDTAVCAGVNDYYLELKDYVGEIVRWEYSLTGGDPWATINNTSSRQDYQNLLQTTYYRAVVKSGECSQEISEVATITVNSPSDAGNAIGNANICNNESALISLNNYTGDSIFWEKSTDQITWNSASIYTDNFNTGNLTTTTYYRAIVNNGTCQSDTSNQIEIIVNPTSVGGTLELDTICSGSSGELELTGYTGNILRWEESANGGNPWAEVQETEVKLNYENFTDTKYYRVVIQSAGCDTVYSEMGGVIVDQNPVVNNIEGANTVCFQINDGDIILSDYSGIIYEWYFSEDNEDSWGIMNLDNDTITYANLELTTHFRAQLQSEYNKCSDIYSNSVKVTVNETTLGGVAGNSATVCSIENQGVIKLSAYRGEILRWEKSNTGKTPWEVIAVTADSLEYIDQKENTYYRAVVQNGACAIEFSDSTLIKVDQASNAGIITGSTSHCAESNQGSLILTNYTGAVSKWESSLDQEIWQYKSYITPNTIDYNNLSDTTYFKVITQNGVCPADTSEIANIKIHPLPIVDFESDTVQLGQATHFNNLSSIPSGSLTEFQWDFDNGSSSIAKQPIETYSEAKTYFVLLKVKSDKGCLDSIKKAVLVYPIPQVDFNFENICLNDTMYFVNSSTISSGTVTYEWSFGDGNTSNLNSPYHIYATDGEYEVTLTATTDKGVQSNKINTVEVYARANIDFQFQDKCEKESVTFLNQANIANGSLNFHWDFGDGQTSTLINGSHAYENYGDYNIELIATSNYNCIDTLIKPISIYPIPIVEFNVDDVPYQTLATFIDNSSIESGTISSWNWSFGDGNYSNAQNPEYLYSSPGNYLVNLSISSDFACNNSIAKNINIYPLPNASFTAENVCHGETVEFINQTSILSGGLNFEWNFDDGETSVETNPVHNYEESGIYTVTLIVISDSDGRDTVQNQIEVYPNPVSDFLVPDVCDGYTSIFTNISTISSGSINSCTWDFGDGTNSIQYSPVKLYLNAGVSNVELHTVSENGCENSIVKEAYVRKNPLADFSVSNECLGVNVNITNHSKCDEGSVSYYWQFGDGANSIIENPDHNYTGSGIYSIKLISRSSYQCVDSLSRYVTIYNLPQVDAGIDTSVSRGFSVVLQASGANIFDWSPAESLDNPGVFNPIARPMETTTYSVRGIDVNNCENTDEITVSVNDDYQVIASNILTPDYNGLNDTWKITNIDAFETATVYIFNRWGEQVYSKKGYMNDWDGRNNNGDVLPDGTYYYIIKFPNSSKHYSGSITILRNQ
ncbi:MAG: DUF2341 domain-containing protein [Bacteroidales bacterium]|nr:DUF2341 domain-containing protein [Bacteroidales bacterium]